MRLKSNQKLICAGQMSLRAPNGKQLAAVPVYKVISDNGENTNHAVSLLPNESLVLVGTVESKESAEARYKAIKEGETPPESHTAPLYIKDKAADSADTAAELTEGEKRALNPLISDLLKEFSAAMRERKTLAE